jgi:myb proto-oncogene protein
MTIVQCQQRWLKILRPGIIKGPWSIEEDALLVCLVGQGFKNWATLAEQLPGRTSKQCRERWYHYLDPSVKKTEFTAEEDEIILKLHAEHGNKWSFISKHLDGRTVMFC